jgi:thioredoxin 1
MKRKNRNMTVVGFAIAVVAFIGYISVSAYTPDAPKKKGVVQMDRAMYIEKIHDFVASPDTFKFKGDRPAVVDFYADWCRPCRTLSPIMEDLSDKYKDKVDFYKINVDKERELAMIHGISSIPVVIIFTGKGKPTSSLGALNKEDYESLINEAIK